MNNRRSFLKIGASASIATIAGFSLSAAESGKPKTKGGSFVEPTRLLPVATETDVIVCGGGPAGFAAAVSAARTGAKTTLIESHGCLGGVWTAGLLSNLIDYQNKPGIMKELVHQLEKSDAQYSAKVYDAELMKLLLEQMCLEAGVEIRLHTRLVAAYKGSGN
jgi:ribulose 1,5-bisphosphate synthetase/thiazole synthase